MSARAVVSGFLFRVPASKTSRAGKPYIFATIREGAGDAIRWWKCFAFSESTIDEFLRLWMAIQSLSRGSSIASSTRPRGQRPASVGRSLPTRFCPPRPGRRRDRKRSRESVTRRERTAINSPHPGRLNDDIPF